MGNLYHTTENVGIGSNTTVSVFSIKKNGELIVYRASTAATTWYSINCAYIAE